MPLDGVVPEHREVRGLGHCPAGGAVREDRQRIDRPAGEMPGALTRRLPRVVLRDQAGSLDEGFVPELYDASLIDSRFSVGPRDAVLEQVIKAANAGSAGARMVNPLRVVVNQDATMAGPEAGRRQGRDPLARRRLVTRWSCFDQPG